MPMRFPKPEDFPPHPTKPGKHIDPATGIFPICEWGAECRRGFVSNSRFASSATEKVIPRTNRSAQKKKHMPLVLPS